MLTNQMNSQDNLKQTNENFIQEAQQTIKQKTNVDKKNGYHTFAFNTSSQKNVSVSSGFQNNSTDLSTSNIIAFDKGNFNVNRHSSETISIQMARIQGDQSTNTIQEENQIFNKQLQSIKSLNHIQLSSNITIQDEEDLSSTNSCYQQCQFLQKNEYFKNSGNNFTLNTNQESVYQNDQNTLQLNKIHSSYIFDFSKTNLSCDLSKKENQLQQLNNSKNQLTLLNEAKNQDEQDKMIIPCINNTIFNYSKPILHQNDSLFQCIPSFYSSQQFINNQKNLEYNNDSKLLQTQKFNEQNDDHSNSNNSSLSQSNFSNQCMASDDQDRDSILNGYENLLKIEHDADFINYKEEQSYESNQFDDGKNIILTKSESIKVKKNEDEIIDQKVFDENFQEKKRNLIGMITDSTQEYWNQFSEKDDEFLLSLYNKVDKNNVNKNILSSFLRYILEKGDELVVECLDAKQKELNIIRKELKNFTRNKKLNNNTINSFFNSKRYSDQFQYYLKFYAIDYFSKSQVKDKNSHFICTAFFLRCFFNNVLREKIVIYNKSKYFKTLTKKRQNSQQSEQLSQNPFTN